MTKSKITREFVETQRNIAFDNARGSIQHVVKTLERAVEEVKRYGEQFETMEDKACVLSWVANYLASGVLNNARIDMLVTYAAQVTMWNMNLDRVNDESK